VAWDFGEKGKGGWRAYGLTLPEGQGRRFAGAMGGTSKILVVEKQL